MRQTKSGRRDRQTLKDKKREETRGKLIAAAKRLFAEHGYDDVPVTEIAREAGVTHSMINVYFGGKPGLLYQIIRENNAPQYEASLRIAEGGGRAVHRLSDMLRLWAEEDASDPRLLAIMQSYSWVWPLDTERENTLDRARFKGLLESLIGEALAAGELRRDLDPKVSAKAVFAIYTWALRDVVFDKLSVSDCHAGMMAQVRTLLKPTKD
ncbi:TetR/AcrR family transcriptional regulator [Roseovarius aestuariivivens]|uniref:TetR/AcrR family transcriptional regulator n=1 Tax=Roseovarius aestuariivivens TaxID=1888910 RepID=UPI001436CC74|nr:TetR/AcrR family transcriptional regulator [Roseovarius aestuariivivens]